VADEWVICAEFDLSAKESGERVVKTEFVMHIRGTRAHGWGLCAAGNGLPPRCQVWGRLAGACLGLVRDWVRPTIL